MHLKLISRVAPLTSVACVRLLVLQAVGDVGEIWTLKNNYSNISLSIASVFPSIRPR